ncbi:MAG TPA: hypothetical protein VGF77_08510 [Allosphingosinicella sp.]|jgi:hypothetical protein
MTPADEPITAYRNAPFAEAFQVVDDDGSAMDFTGYAGAMQVRLYGGQAGSAQISLSTVTDSSQGIRFDADSLFIQVDEATLATVYDGLVGSNERPWTAELVYDLVLTPPGSLQEIWIEGDFLIAPGVTVSDPITTAVLTEAGDYLVTEAGDILLQE